MNTLNNIQMLRGVASLLVIFHHLLPHYIAMGGDLEIIKSISTWGFLGVDIFFIISGFIMAYTTFNKPRTLESAKIFIKHRAFRIYLAYWIFWVVALVITYITNPLKIDSYNLFTSLFLLDIDMSRLVLPISWSLSYELYFYLLFTASFIFSLSILNRLMPIIFLILLSLAVMTHLSIIPISFFYSHFLLEFFAGVLLYIYRDKIIRLSILPLLLIITIIAYWYGVTDELKNGLYRVLTFGVGALTLVWSFLILEREGIYRAKGYSTLLGDASYTIYLSHLVIIWLFYFSGLRGLFTSDNIMTPLIGWIVAIATILIFSTIYYIKIEKPLYKKAISL